MTRFIEEFLPPIKEDGITTNKNVSVGGTLAVAGATTLTGTTQLTGVATFSATPVFSAGIARVVNQSALVGATIVLTAADSNSVNINRSTSGSPSWTLPAATTSGLAYTFVTANTTAGFTITGAQAIHAKTNATGTAITSTTTITNTQATAVVGDHITIVSDGAVWWITSQSGVFAAS